MKKVIKRIAGRIFIVLLIAFAIYLLIGNIDFIRDLAIREKTIVIIDSDAANGVDDLCSIMRIMKAEEVEVRGLLSAQWRLADLENDSCIVSSQLLHRFVLEHFRKPNIPCSSGYDLPLLYTKGKDNSLNAAASVINKTVRELPYGEKLNMLCLGSATNLASAILEWPEISDKIICYIQGPAYNPSRRAWNKNDVISRLDLEAMDILLNDKDLEIHLLPANVADDFMLARPGDLENMVDADTLSKFILERCMSLQADADSIPCSSLGLIEAFLNPDMASSKQLITPPENSQRKIYVYTRINVDRMKKDFLGAV
jgi:inosine-uridine nucleoside N-ribohydrolase